MHSLDINFLNDRAERPAVASRGAARSPGGGGDNKPLIIGAIAGLIPVAGVLGFWFLTQNQVKNLRAQDQQLEQELQVLNQQLAEVGQKRQQIDAVNQENQAMGNVLKIIRPWSAVLFDIQQRTPPRIQIEAVTQTEGVADKLPTGEEGELPLLGGVEIAGFACTFDDVNDFILVLQRSQFFERNDVELVTANLIDDDAELGRCPGDPENTQQIKLIEYEIRANLVDIPENPEEFQALVNVLEQNNAIGLLARIRALQNIGVIEP